jgi:hypothetical protein
MSRTSPTSTVVGMPTADRVVITCGAPTLGALIGLFLPWIAGQLLRLPWVPMGGPLRLIASLHEGWRLGICVAVGVVLGLGFAVIAVTESLKITVTDAMIRLDKDRHTWFLAKDDVHAAFRDGKRLVILGADSQVLLTEVHEASGEALGEAFRAHGYPWASEDPYSALFRKWEPGSPGLPSAVDTLLAAREVALRRRSTDAVKDLEKDLSRLGYVVRDDARTQYWRPLSRS